MKVRFHKSCREKFGDENVQAMHEAVMFFLDKFDLNKYTHSLDIHTDAKEITKYPLDTRAVIIDYGKRSEIHLRFTLFADDLVTNIFHELTHLKQALYGELVSNRGRDIWKGAPFPRVCHSKLDYDTYWNLPWEVEARAVASEMLTLFKNQRKPKSFWQKLKFWRI